MPRKTTPPSLTLSRPRLLIDAAHAGAKLYRRNRDLPVVAPKVYASTGNDRLATRLMALEARCDEERRSHAVSYSPSRHVRLLSALIAEFRALSGPRRASHCS